MLNAIYDENRWLNMVAIETSSKVRLSPLLHFLQRGFPKDSSHGIIPLYPPESTWEKLIRETVKHSENYQVLFSFGFVVYIKVSIRFNVYIKN